MPSWGGWMYRYGVFVIYRLVLDLEQSVFRQGRFSCVKLRC